MANLRISRFQFYTILQCILLIQSNVLCSQYKVGDLDAWSIPTEANKNVYAKWTKTHSFKIGDSLFFLYPPSIDSVLQVSKEAYMNCDLKDPILTMNNGNSLFNITTSDELFFTSGEKGHCEKYQKLYISLGGNGSSDPSSLPSTASAPSYTNAFGSVPAQPSSSSSSYSSPLVKFPVLALVFIGLLTFALVR